MGKTLYLECASGISADMVVAALLDLGANEEGLRRALASLELEGFEIVVSHKQAGAISACDFDVVLDKAHDGHDHDMAYLYDNLDIEEEAEPKRLLRHHHRPHLNLMRGKPAPERDMEPEVQHDSLHHHEHRSPAEILSIIEASDLAPRAQKLAKCIFTILAEAEAKAHGVPVEEVLFHEVGAVDSIVDVVAVAYFIDELDISDVYVSPLAEGYGRIRTAHGVLPVPVPAVVNIVSSSDLALMPTRCHGELITPTGAAIAAALKNMSELPGAYQIKHVGYGVGKRAYNPPSTVRAFIIEACPDTQNTQVAEAAETSHEASRYANFTPHLWKLETEMDDITGEALGNLLDKLFAAGAAEAHYIPVYMKKNRPSWQVEIICTSDHISELERVLFEEGTTIGVRRYPLDRTALVRKRVELNSSMGTVSVKQVTLPDGKQRSYPEYDEVKRIATEQDISYQEAYRAIVVALNNQEF